jgi:Mce-associated membrane protein
MNETVSPAVDSTDQPLPHRVDRDAVAESPDDEASADTQQLEQMSHATVLIARDRAAARRRGIPVRSVVALWVAVAMASMAQPTWMYVFRARPDEQTGPAAQQAALAAATDGSVALLSYSSNDVDRDIAAAKSHLTGGLLAYFTTFAEQTVRPAAKQKSVETTAAVTKAAVSDMHPGSASVLLFITQTTKSSDHPEPWLTTSTVVVTVDNVGGSWLIEKFEPV